MQKTSRPAKLPAIVSLGMAVLAFTLGSAALTPAFALAAIALPIAIGCLFFRVWRLSAMTVYWSLASFLAVPFSRYTGIGVDFSLAILGALGLALAAFLHVGHLHDKPCRD